MLNKFLLEAFQTPDQVAKQLAPYFENLPVDPYINGDYRFRAYSRYKVAHENITREPHTSFTQPANVNKLLGDIVRDYQALDNQLDQQPEFQHLLASFAQHIGIKSDVDTIDVHQIKVVSTADNMGSPAPEGIHQDGNRFVGIFCVKRDNVDGGYTQLFSSPAERPHLYTVLEENQFIIINDQRYYHYVSETLAHDKGKLGIRDVFVFTA